MLQRNTTSWLHPAPVGFHRIVKVPTKYRLELMNSPPDSFLWIISHHLDLADQVVVRKKRYDCPEVVLLLIRAFSHEELMPHARRSFGMSAGIRRWAKNAQRK